MNTATRLIPHACALALLAACGVAKAATPDVAGPRLAVALVSGSWDCRMQGGTAYPGAIMEYSASFLKDGATTLDGVIRMRQDGKPLELTYTSRGAWSAKGGMLHRDVTQHGVVSATLGGNPVDHRLLDKQFAELVSADPSVNSTASELLNVTRDEMVLGEEDGGIATCRRAA